MSGRQNAREESAPRIDTSEVAELVLEEMVLAERGRSMLGLSVFSSYDAALWKRLAVG